MGEYLLLHVVLPFILTNGLSAEIFLNKFIYSFCRRLNQAFIHRTQRYDFQEFDSRGRLFLTGETNFQLKQTEYWH